MKVPADAALGLEPFDGRIASWFAASDDRNLDMELLQAAAQERAGMRRSSTA